MLIPVMDEDDVKNNSDGEKRAGRPAKEHDQLWKLKEEVRNGASNLKVRLLGEEPEVAESLLVLPGISDLSDVGSYELVRGKWKFLKRAPLTLGDIKLEDIFSGAKLLSLRMKRENWQDEKKVDSYNSIFDELIAKIRPLIEADERGVNTYWMERLASLGLETISSRDIHTSEIVRVNDLLGRKNEKPKIIVENLLARGWIGLLAGASKSNKSWMSLSLALEATKGGEWLGFQCQQSRVLYVDYELSHASIVQRLKKLKLDSAEANYGPDFLILGSSPRRESQIELILNAIRKTKYPNSEVDDGRGVQEVYSSISHNGRRVDHGRPRLYVKEEDCELFSDVYDLIIIDPLYMLLNGRDENSATDMVDVFKEIQLLKKVTGAAVLIITHFRKGARDWRSSSSDRISGSGVFTRFPDLILTLNRLGEGMSKSKQKLLNNRYTLDITLRHLRGMDHLGLQFSVDDCTFSLLRSDQTELAFKTTASSRGGPRKYDKGILKFLRNNYSRLNQKPLAEVVKELEKSSIGASRPTYYRFFEKRSEHVQLVDKEKLVFLAFAERNA